MVMDIVIGRNERDKEKYGSKGTVLLGKHYVKMGQVTALSNRILLDVTRSHVVFICGKRGGGKSYTMGVIAEGVSDLPPEIKKNISVILLDTMGVYWTMKYGNRKDEELLKKWGFAPKELNVQIYTPYGYYQQFKEQGIPTDFPFSLLASELDANDWCITFEVSQNDPMGVLIERVIQHLKERGGDYTINDILSEVRNDARCDAMVRDAVENRFIATKHWGLFTAKGTPLKDIVAGGQVTVLDVSCYATMPGAERIKNLVIGLVAQKLFVERMIARRNEEFEAIHESFHYFDEEKVVENDFPMVWLVIDEAHEFLPLIGKTTASDPLITILREGRQPGISLILATQQPGKIHTDVMTQSDTVISHRLTAKIDVEALGMLMQSYMREGLDKYLNELPRVKGAAIIFDDTNERLYPIQVRPRFTWHGGEAPTAMRDSEKRFEL
ncbi:nucleotidyltransferase [Candidatus Woesearchaeota archaeon CG_4_10_14_0_8_um_filter_47_5]|nr:MAG: nucleotidyltransferase [Candidatus Woesearchaeota archaeon CG_4_10_14_0_8_um_filter_47_5]